MIPALNKKCNSCGVYLVIGENISPSRAKRHSWLCGKCRYQKYKDCSWRKTSSKEAREKNKKRWANESPYKPSETKACAVCKKEKAKTSQNFYKSRTISSGIHPTCISCVKKRVRSPVDSLYTRHGIQQEDKEVLLKRQNYECGLCKQKMSLKEAQVDHDHSIFPGPKKTTLSKHPRKIRRESIRSLLCHICNKRLGWYEVFLRNPGLLEQMDRYLENPPQKTTP